MIGLKRDHVSKTGRTDIDEQITASIRKFSERAKDETVRQKYVVEMPEYITTKAALISAHFLLPAGSKIVDMACGKGEISYVLAQLNPRAEIIGIDRDPAAIEFARRTFRLPNLSFRIDDIGIDDFPDGSIEGIVNSNVFHRIYSASSYNAGDVSSLMERQIRKLKPGGTMLVRDFMKPPDDEYVLLELPDAPSHGTTIETLSLAELLIRFSQTARPLAMGCEGFFLEELAPNREKTRLFRLPHKWALEFVYRKEYREQWDHELKKEYTFFTWQDYRREFARCGMRMVYSAPYWNPWVLKHSFYKRFQLYTEQGVAMSPPATNYFIVAQKMTDRQSLVLEERRPSQLPASELEVITVRDKKSGRIHELVRRPGERCDIIPYRLTRDGRLVIYVRSGYPRPIVNAVYRGNANLDGKRWSGHLVEPITMNTVDMTDDIESNKDKIIAFADLYASLKVTKKDSLYVGAAWYPAPDRIDEAIEPVFMEVYDPERTTWPIKGASNIGFVEAGTIIELDAGDIIRASQVGLLPEPRLELHAFELMQRYGIAAPGWIGEKIPIPGASKLKDVGDPEEMLAELEETEFETEKGKAKHLKAVRSTFVEEGKVGSAMRGLASKDVEFIVTDDGIENIAVVLPMTKGWDNSVMIAVEAQMLPVPQRVGGVGSMLTAPSFVLPKDVKTIEAAKIYIAGKFGVDPERVGQLGESYFTHIGVSPQRVYPFMIATDGELRVTHRKYVHMKRLAWLWSFQRFSGDLLKLVARAHMRLGAEHNLAPERSPVSLKNKGFSLSTEKVEVEVPKEGGQQQQKAPSSKILGQRRVHIASSSSSGEGGAPKPDDREMYKPEDMPDIEKENQKRKQAVDVELDPPDDVKKNKGRLKSSYSHALSSLAVKVKDTKMIKRIDREIFKIGTKLKKVEKKKNSHPLQRPPDGTL